LRGEFSQPQQSDLIVGQSDVYQEIKAKAVPGSFQQYEILSGL